MRLAVSVFSFLVAVLPIIAQSPPKQVDQRNLTAVSQQATVGGVQILSDTQGVDFSRWLIDWHRETEQTWQPLIPPEVNPPKLKKGKVAIRFKVLPSGRLKDGSMLLEGRSGHTALDRAAWSALVGSKYQPLPSDFRGPYLELRVYFLYNMEPQR